MFVMDNNPLSIYMVKEVVYIRFLKYSLSCSMVLSPLLHRYMYFMGSNSTAQPFLF